MLMENVQRLQCQANYICHSLYCIVYSPSKYRETEGIKDIGTQFWNQGRTEEIADRVLHVGKEVK